VAALHDVLRRVAVYELSRRRGQLRSVSGPEFDDLAQQAADDALVKVLGKLDDFRGLSRFTTWAYKFVIFEVSAKVARHRGAGSRRDSRTLLGRVVRSHCCESRSSPTGGMVEWCLQTALSSAMPVSLFA
jgi:DNA-directed RNA polymerase specialized sigma24 family protein